MTLVDGPFSQLLRRSTLLSVLGISILLLTFRSRLLETAGFHDFTSFLAGAELLGTHDIYNVPANLAEQRALAGYTVPGMVFTRPPFFAVALRPFTWLPYRDALLVWKMLLIAALVGFACCFPLSRGYALLALGCSLPAAAAVSVAGDAPLVLFLIGASLAVWKKGHRVLSGVLLGLCLAKFHFLVFLPLLLCRREYRRVLAGFAGTAVALITLSFSVQPNWLMRYSHILAFADEINTHPALMPNFYASFFWTGHAGIAVALGALLITGLLWPICHRTPFEIAMPLCLFGGTLAAPHTNQIDAILAIPALLLVAATFREIRLLSVVLLSPVAALLYCLWASVGPLLFVSGSLYLLWQIGYVYTRKDRAANSVNTQTCSSCSPAWTLPCSPSKPRSNS